MCGIVGVIGDIDKTSREVFKQLLFADTFRGYDSTGLISVSYLHNPRVYKKAVAAPDFLLMKPVENLLYGSALIGHNRWATKGQINSNNAHPFEFGDFCGVHNGTLRQQGLLPDSNKFPVDSENIYYSLDKIGIEETLKKLNGSYALVWFNSRTNQVQMVRNHERPLSYAFSDDLKRLYYASEGKMLEWILDRNNVKHKGIVEVVPNHLYSFDVSVPFGKGIQSSVRKITPFTTPSNKSKSNVHHLKSKTDKKKLVKEMDSYRYKDLIFQIGIEKKKAHFNRDCYTLLPIKDIEVDGKDVEVRIVDTRIFQKLDKEKKKGNYVKAQLLYGDAESSPPFFVVLSDSISFVDEADIEEDDTSTDAPFLELYEGYDGEILTEEDWKEATKKGCAWCSSPAVASEKNFFINHNEFICESCQGIPEVLSYLKAGEEVS